MNHFDEDQGVARDILCENALKLLCPGLLRLLKERVKKENEDPNQMKDQRQ